MANSTPSTEIENDSKEESLLHGSPSKKDFFDKIKQLKKQENNDEEKEIIVDVPAVDHDLQTYKSPPKKREIVIKHFLSDYEFFIFRLGNRLVQILRNESEI